MSQCPDCGDSFSHEDGHNCPGPQELWVLFRRLKTDSPNKHSWVPVKAVKKANQKQVQYITSAMLAKHPKCEFGWQLYGFKPLA